MDCFNDKNYTRWLRLYTEDSGFTLAYTYPKYEM
jgi:hypothetical protein